MAELDTLYLVNPTSEDFTHNYNGEPYTVKAGETKAFAKYVAYHLAKHLSSKMVQQEALKKATKDELKELKVQNSAFNAKLAQLAVFDTHERRIALYKILGDTQKVLDVIRSYPFKGFIGDMGLYEQFVAEEGAKKQT